MGQDAETQLRVDCSVASGINRTAIEDDSSLLLLAWPGPTNFRSQVLGASYSEIVASTSVPVLIAALRARRLDDEPSDRGNREPKTKDTVASHAPQAALQPKLR